MNDNSEQLLSWLAIYRGRYYKRPSGPLLYGYRLLTPTRIVDGVAEFLPESQYSIEDPGETIFMRKKLHMFAAPGSVMQVRYENPELDENQFPIYFRQGAGDVLYIDEEQLWVKQLQVEDRVQFELSRGVSRAKRMERQSWLKRIIDDLQRAIEPLSWAEKRAFVEYLLARLL